MKGNKSLYIILVIVAIILFCFISTFFGIITIDTLPVNFFGAVLGSLIGALITFILLKGQKDFEENKEKSIRILEEKRDVFKDYIKNIWNVWNDQEITIEEFQNLTSKYYQELMIYLKGERLKTIGSSLSEIGKCINKNKKDNINILQNNIITIINELSKELELGGEIDKNIMEEHDKIVFPLLLKNEILNSLNKELPTDEILQKGKYENFREGRWNLEYICFNFKNYSDCKILIGPFDKKQIWFILIVDKKYNQVDNSLRSGGVYFQRIKFNRTVDLRDFIQDKDYEENDKEKAPPLDFSDNEILEIYRTKKRDFANTIAKRTSYWFSELRIDKINVSIMEFLDKYIKQG